MTRMHRILAGILDAFEALIPGSTDDALEHDYDAAVRRAEAALVEDEAENEVHEAKTDVQCWSCKTWLPISGIVVPGDHVRCECGVIVWLPAPVIASENGPGWRDLAADNEVHEPKITAWTSDWKRTVQSLGIDERGTTWRAANGHTWRWDTHRWWYRPKDATLFGPAPYDYWPSGSAPYVAVDPDAPVMDWRGWSVPAILEVLAEYVDDSEFDIDSIAVQIADRIACDPQRAIEALTHDRPTRVDK